MPADRADGVVFAEHGALGILALGEVQERAAGQGALGFGPRHADRLEDGRVAVDQRDRCPDPPAARHAAPLQDQRHADRLLVHVGLAPEGAAAEVVAVIARVDDERVLAQAARLERAQDLADVVVEEGDHAVIRRDRHADVGLVPEMVLVVLDLAQLAQHRMVRELVRRAQARQRQVVERIEGVELGRGDQRKVRADEGDEQAPGLVAPVPGGAPQPGDGGIADLAVVGEVGRIRPTRHRPRAAPCWCAWADPGAACPGRRPYRPARGAAGSRCRSRSDRRCRGSAACRSSRSGGHARAAGGRRTAASPYKESRCPSSRSRGRSGRWRSLPGSARRSGSWRRRSRTACLRRPAGRGAGS